MKDGEKLPAPGEIVKVDAVFAPPQLVDVWAPPRATASRASSSATTSPAVSVSHGSKSWRDPGAVSSNQCPGRLFPGKSLGGHMGDVRRTVRNLEVIRVEPELNLLYVKGGVPGPTGGYLFIEKAKAASPRWRRDDGPQEGSGRRQLSPTPRRRLTKEKPSASRSRTRRVPTRAPSRSTSPSSVAWSRTASCTPRRSSISRTSAPARTAPRRAPRSLARRRSSTVKRARVALAPAIARPAQRRHGGIVHGPRRAATTFRCRRRASRRGQLGRPREGRRTARSRSSRARLRRKTKAMIAALTKTLGLIKKGERPRSSSSRTASTRSSTSRSATSPGRPRPGRGANTREVLTHRRSLHQAGVREVPGARREAYREKARKLKGTRKGNEAAAAPAAAK